MKKCILSLAMVISIVQLSGCAPDGRMNKTDFSTLAGGATGALIGSQIAGDAAVGAAIGAVVGGVAGNYFAYHYLDNYDATRHQQTQQRALQHNKVGVTSEWRNPDHSTRGTITPTRTYMENTRDGSSKHYCREYTQVIYVGGKKHEGYGKACRQPDGTWKIVDEHDGGHYN